MYQRTNNYLRPFGGQRDPVICQSRDGLLRRRHRYKSLRASYLASLLLFTLTIQPMLAQGKFPEPVQQIKIADIAISDVLPPSMAPAPAPTVTESPSPASPAPEPPVLATPAPLSPASPSPVPVSPTPMSLVPVTPAQEPQAQVSPARRPITISDAVSIFLQQNLQLVAARYDIDTAEAEKLTARLRPNPQLNISTSGTPLTFSGPLLKEQTYDYGVSQTFELGGKRRKRMDAANANADLARGQFQAVVWQLTNDLKRKFYTALLDESLLKLAQENQKTFAETLRQTTELYKAGEISGLELTRLEVEKLKFDTDVANSERDYEVAVRDLRFTLGGDYRTIDVDVAGTLDYQPYDFSPEELRDKALAARPDLKAAQLSERAANASIRLQNAQRIPDLTVGAGIEQVPLDANTYNVGVGITLPLFDRNQGERAKAVIDRKRAQNQQQLLTNQVLSDVDKALVAVEIQKRRVELYRTGVLTKVDQIQNLTEFALKAGESSTLDLLDALRTRRDTLAGYYQALFDYQMSLLDLELATATPLPAK
jgi:cobalt-zinc-cadmium efflux system outer membrane protein